MSPSLGVVGGLYLLLLGIDAAAGIAFTPADAIGRLTTWVTASGGNVAAVSVREVDGMRGVALADDGVSALETEFMVVPAALALSDDIDELLERSPLAAKVGRTSLGLLQPDAHLALRLLHERSLGEDSPWSDYIKLLPPHVHVARHISDEALLACRSDFLLKQSMLARKYAGNVHSTLTRLVGEGGGQGQGGGGKEGGGKKGTLGFDEATLGWALDVVHSRSFSVDVGARGMRRFMVPLIDMLNHNPDAGCAFAYDDTDEPPSFIVELPEGREEAKPDPGKQLWLDYGPQSSEELWLMYGFVPSAPSPYDTVTLVGAYSPADLDAAPGDEAMLEEKRYLLASCRYDPPREFELAGRKVDPAVISALRLLFLTQEELEEECAGSWNRPLLHAPVSSRNEMCVARALMARLRGLLEDEGSSLEEDKALIADLEAGPSEEEEDDEEDAEEAAEREEMRCAIQLRANRKTLLCECISVMEDFARELEAAAAEAEAAASGGTEQQPPRTPNLHDAFDDYMPNIRLT